MCYHEEMEVNNVGKYGFRASTRTMNGRAEELGQCNLDNDHQHRAPSAL